MIRQFFSGLILLLTSMFAYAQEPVEFIKGISNEMLHTLQAQHAQLKGHPEKVIPIVNRLLVPYADVEEMSRAVMGKYWNEASAAQRSRFEAEFTRLVVRTYAAAFEQYTNQTIEFGRTIPVGTTGDKAEVKTIIKQSGGAPPIPVNYRVLKKGDTWKVYDINVEGISLINSYKGQFAAQMAKMGIDNFINEMAKRNK